jgi:hypothetical protein
MRIFDFDMKYLLFLCCLGLLGVQCKSDSAPPPPSGQSVAPAPATKDGSNPSATVAQGKLGADAIKALLQGRWKSQTEAGVEYDIKDFAVQPFKNGQALKPMDAEYSSDCGIPCGALNKRFRNYSGCVTLKGVDGFCIAILSATSNRIEFARLGANNSEPEVWVK